MSKNHTQIPLPLPLPLVNNLFLHFWFGSIPANILNSFNKFTFTYSYCFILFISFSLHSKWNAQRWMKRLILICRHQITKNILQWAEFIIFFFIFQYFYIIIIIYVIYEWEKNSRKTFLIKCMRKYFFSLWINFRFVLLILLLERPTSVHHSLWTQFYPEKIAFTIAKFLVNG